jgi:hypothetical protein
VLFDTFRLILKLIAVTKVHGLNIQVLFVSIFHFPISNQIKDQLHILQISNLTEFINNKTFFFFFCYKKEMISSCAGKTIDDSNKKKKQEKQLDKMKKGKNTYMESRRQSKEGKATSTAKMNTHTNKGKHFLHVELFLYLSIFLFFVCFAIQPIVRPTSREILLY